MNGDPTEQVQSTTSANFVTTAWPYQYTPQWTIVGNCPKCDSPYLAQLNSITVPAVHKSCACEQPKRRRRRQLAADGLPKVTPDRKTKPIDFDVPEQIAT